MLWMPHYSNCSVHEVCLSPAALDVGRRSELDAAYQEGSQYLQSIGIESKGEIARILDIAMNPNSLFPTLRDKKRAVNVHVRTRPNVQCCTNLCGLVPYLPCTPSLSTLMIVWAEVEPERLQEL